MKIHTATSHDFARAGVEPFHSDATPDGMSGNPTFTMAAFASAGLSVPKLRTIPLPEGAEEVPAIKDADIVLVAAELGEANGASHGNWKLSPLALLRLSQYHGVRPEQIVVFDAWSGFEWDPSTPWNILSAADRQLPKAVREYKEAQLRDGIEAACKRMHFIRSYPTAPIVGNVIPWPVPVPDLGYSSPGRLDISAVGWEGNGLALVSRQSILDKTLKPGDERDPAKDASIDIIGKLKSARANDLKLDVKTELASSATVATMRPLHDKILSEVATLAGVSAQDGDRRRLESVRGAKMMLCTRTQTGVMPVSFYEACSLGRIPVLVGTEECAWPVTDGARDYSLRIPAADAEHTGMLVYHYIKGKSPEELEAVCQKARRAWETCFAPDRWPVLLGQTLQRLMK